MSFDHSRVSATNTLINMQCFLNQHKQLTINLAREEELPNYEIEKSIENAYILAQKTISIEGSEDFKKITKARLKKICKLKPGRKLFELLCIQQKTIKCIEDKSFRYDNRDRVLHLEGESSYKKYYNSFDEKGQKISIKYKKYILIIHELIHALHIHNEKPDIDCLDNMDDIEEQHTIIGFNHKIFQEKLFLDEIDVICENTFHLALNRPPRIDHQNGKQETSSEDFCISNDKYFKWVENEILSITSINDKKNDHNFAIEYLKVHPNSFNAISSELRNDADFLIAASKIIGTGKILKIHPDSKNNKTFMMHCVKENIYDIGFVFHIPDDWWSDKEFVSFAMRTCDRSVRFFIYGKMHETLRSDPEIINFVSFRV